MTDNYGASDKRPDIVCLVLGDMKNFVEYEDCHEKGSRLKAFDHKTVLDQAADFGKTEPNVSSNYHEHCHLQQETDKKPLIVEFIKRIKEPQSLHNMKRRVI